MVLRLFENRVGDNRIGARSFDNNDFTHCSSAIVAEIAQYLASVEERATMCCFVEL